jgi:uncharacterized protein YndB with AHSA1/START domain
MSEYRQQGLIGAPIDRVWSLVGNPACYPDWFPRVLEVRGDEFAIGTVYTQVTRNPLGERTTSLQIDELEDMRSLRFHCIDTGLYTSWVLTPAQSSTFVDAEFGMEPATLGNKLFDATAGRAYFRRWLDETFRALEQAAAGIEA